MSQCVVIRESEVTLVNSEGQEITVGFVAGSDRMGSDLPKVFIDTSELDEDSDGPLIDVSMNDSTLVRSSKDWE